MKLKKSYLMMAPAVLMGAQAALAQGPALEEVIVTATKRATSTMDTPLSMETISGEALTQGNIGNLVDLVTRVPNVNITDGAQTNRISIRGVGPGNDRGFEQAVATFIDGIYMPRSRQYRSPFFDMERIEILRGPQAVLYGLNATAGTILIHSNTTRAGDESELVLRGGYETEYEGYYTEAIGGMSVGDSLGLRLALRYNDTGDGYWENQVTGQDENSMEETNVRFTADWAVSDSWTITTKVSYTDAEEEGNYGEQVFSNDTPPFTAEVAEATGFFPDRKLDYKRFTDNVPTDFLGEDVGLDHDITNIVINSEMDVGNNTLNVLLSYSESNYDQVYNVDAFASYPGNPSGTEALLGQGLGNVIDEDYEQAAIEIRWASPAEATVSYILGLYADTNELTNDLDSFGGLLLGGDTFGGAGVRTKQAQKQDAEMISPYATVTWLVTEKLRLTGGLRYSSQDKDYERDTFTCTNLLNELFVPAEVFGQTPGPGGWYAFAELPVDSGAPCGTLDGLDQTRNSDNWMPEVIAQYDLSDNMVGYAKYGESAKAGGFVFSGTLRTAEEAEYDDEEATAFEIGLKSRLLDERLELNIAAFYNEFDDLQVSGFNTPPGSAPILVISNDGSSTSEGVELEVNFAATDWMTVGTSLAWLNSEFDDFKTGQCSIPEIASTGSQECDRSGDDTPFSPEYSGSAYADLAIPLGANLVLNGGVMVSFSDDYFTEAALNPAAQQESYEMWDARIGLADADNKWSVSVVGKNLTDEEVIGMGVPFAGMIGYLGAPKTIMVQGEFRF